MNMPRDLPAAQRHRLSWSDVEKMLQAGILHEDQRIEFLDGELIDMAPIGSRHAGVVNHLATLFAHELGTRAIVAAQNPVALSEYSCPQPDIVLLKTRADFYRDAHPGPEDVLLLVEVADTSYRYDREVKLPLYARHGIAEVWLVDIERRCLEIYREPQPASEDYREIRVLHSGLATPAAFPHMAVDLGPLLG